MNSVLKIFKIELHQELQNILAWWMRYAVDDTYGGFHGKIDRNNRVQERAVKGLVLNARILWAFSAAYRHTGDKACLMMAARACEYLTVYFTDKKYGGLYWALDYKGQPLQDRKQVYGLAFGIYGLSEYYLATQDQAARALAIGLFNEIELHSFDHQYSGYVDALSRDWQQTDDLRLGDKDPNEKKTMNTHLHIMEAYTNLFRCNGDSQLADKIRNLVRIFLEHILQKETSHLGLFFDDRWNNKGNIISFGHDIEASWLLTEAAEITGDRSLVNELLPVSIRLADAAAEGIDRDGGLENEIREGLPDRERHWWQQAESMVGFFNAYQISRDDRYLQRSLGSWEFIKKYILDRQYGEWFWGLAPGNKVMEREDKAGFWKCPYHNTRACLEVIGRIDRLLSAEKPL